MKCCEKYAALLDLFVDGELSAEEMGAVQAHLENCPGCQAYVDDALTVRAAFPQVEDTAVPEGFARRVMERVQACAGNSKTRRKQAWVKVLLPMAACCALVLVLRGVPQKTGERMDATADQGLQESAPAGASEGGALPETEEKNGDALQNRAFSFKEVPQEDAVEEEAQESAQIATAAGPAAARPHSAAPAAGAQSDAGTPAKEEGGASAPEPPALTSPALAPQSSQAETAGEALEEEAYLLLTAQEAGSLLDEFTPLEIQGEVRWYRLTPAEYGLLLKGLSSGGVVGEFDLDAWKKEAAEKEWILVAVEPS